MAFDFVKDQDKEIIIKVQVARPTRFAFRFPKEIPSEQIVITEYLIRNFEGVSARKLDTGSRVSFKTDPKYSYAYYRVTPRMIAIGTGLTVGAIAGAFIAIRLAPAILAGLGLVGASSSISAFLLSASATAGATIGAITGYLINKQFPKYIHSDDPKTNVFFSEIINNNPGTYKDSSQIFSFWSVDDGDPRDMYRFFKTVKATGEKLPEILNNIADAGKDTASFLSELIKIAPYAALGYAGWKFYNKEKGN